MTVLTESKHELAARNGLEMTPTFLATAGASLSAEERKEVSAGEFYMLAAESKLLDGLLIRDNLTLIGCEGLTLKNSYILGEVIVESADVLLENCLLHHASVKADNVQLRHCTVEGGVISFENCENPLVALSSATAIVFGGAHNAVCLLNHSVTVSASGCRSLYICENEIDVSLSLAECDHLIVNGNMAEGAELVMDKVTHFVGNNVTNINERRACGVNEALLPQMDKECFVYMPRRDTVHEEKARGAREYLMEEAKEKPFVILPPGAYRVWEQIQFDGITDGCVVYAYGVLLDEQRYDFTAIRVSDSKAFVIKGLQVDHTVNTTGQGIVIGGNGVDTLYVMTSAGMLPDWTDPRYYSGSTLYHYLPGHPEFNNDGIPVKKRTFDPITRQNHLLLNPAVYKTISVGDTVAVRGKGGGLFYFTTSEDIYVEDVAIYGCAGFAISEGRCTSPTILHRMWDTTKAPALIDRATYEAYKLYEKLFSVDFGVYEEKAPDGSIAYRGTAPICSSVDATHTTGSAYGTTAISCLFESMCDDATNQNSMHGRLHAVRDNGDGTVTVTYKTNVSPVSFVNKNYNGNACREFRVGDRAFIYTSSGRLICDSPVLSVATLEPTENQWGGRTDLFEITLASDAFDLAATEIYEMTSDLPAVPKILIDNMSRASCGFVFDNMLIRYVRSRGLLIKTSNGTVRNCSFYKCGKGCIAILYEIKWGESGVSEHLSIKNNYFEETGYLENLPRYSPIAIEGLGSRTEDEYLPYHDIRFEGNVVKNRGGTYAVYLNSARNIQLINNDFGTRKGETKEDPFPSVFIDAAKDVELSGNTYSPYLSDITEQVTVQKSIHIFGEDAGECLVCPPELFEGLEKTTPVLHPCKITNEGLADYSVTKWTAEYLPVSELTGTCYPYVNGSGWYAADPVRSGEGNTGGIQKEIGYFTPQPDYNVGFAYTLAEDREGYLGFENLISPTVGTAYIAVFINDKMVWPTEGGSYTDEKDWYLLDGSRADRAAAAISKRRFDFRRGDVVRFIGKLAFGTQLFTLMPAIGLEK